jgi:subtilisin family serine protease
MKKQSQKLGSKLSFVGMICLSAILTSTAVFAQQAVVIKSRAGEKRSAGEMQEFINKLVESRISPELHAVVQLQGEFKGFAKKRAADGQPGLSEPQALVAIGGAVPVAQNDFFIIEPAAAGLDNNGQQMAIPLLQLTCLPNSQANEDRLKAAGFELVSPEGSPKIVDLGEIGKVMTLKPITGKVDKTNVEALLAIEGIKYVSPVYPAGKLQPQSPEAGTPGELNEAMAIPVAGGSSCDKREPNDTDYRRLWGMENIRAPLAWGKQTDAGSIIVAVIDTGVDYAHVDLRDNMWVNSAEASGRAGVDDDRNGYVDDVHGIGVGPAFGRNSDPDGHGTHCAGTIGAVGDNGRGVAGVCWRVKIMGIRFLGGTVPAAAAVKYAVDNGAQVLSNSWTSFGFYDQGLVAAIDYAKLKNAIFVAAAANNSNDNDVNPYYPSSYPNDNVIAVGAIDSNNARASFSHWGKTSVDLFAPGVGIWSTVPGNQLNTMSGTSMACPHVSGACALVWASKGPSSSWGDIRSYILTNARVVPGLASLCVTGGTLDIGNLANDTVRIAGQ